MPAPLELLLKSIGQGMNTFTDEQWQHYGGDDILSEILKLDPNARVFDTDIGGGEGGSQGRGKQIDFDFTKLPKSKMGTFGLDLRPENASPKGLYRPDMVLDDKNYGRVTNSKNVKHDTGGLHAWGPMIAALIAMGGPALAGALAAGGIGGAGLTGAVTGSGLFGSAPPWLTGLVKGGPGMMDKVSSGDFASLLPLLISVGGNAAGIDPMLTRGGTTIAQLARKR